MEACALTLDKELEILLGRDRPRGPWLLWGDACILTLGHKDSSVGVTGLQHSSTSVYLTGRPSRLTTTQELYPTGLIPSKVKPAPGTLPRA